MYFNVSGTVKLQLGYKCTSIVLKDATLVVHNGGTPFSYVFLLGLDTSAGINGEGSEDGTAHHTLILCTDGSDL